MLHKCYTCVAMHTFTMVISTPARCKIGVAFFSNRLLAFLYKVT